MLYVKVMLLVDICLILFTYFKNVRFHQLRHLTSKNLPCCRNARRFGNIHRGIWRTPGGLVKEAAALQHISGI
jgi:hypothetical protein